MQLHHSPTPARPPVLRRFAKTLLSKELEFSTRLLDSSHRERRLCAPVPSAGSLISAPRIRTAPCWENNINAWQTAWQQRLWRSFKRKPNMWASPRPRDQLLRSANQELSTPELWAAATYARKEDLEAQHLQHLTEAASLQQGASIQSSSKKRKKKSQSISTSSPAWESPKERSQHRREVLFHHLTGVSAF